MLFTYIACGVVLSNFSHLHTLCHLLTFYVTYVPVLHTKQHNSLPFLSCARPLHQYALPTQQLALGQRAILMWGVEECGGFLEEQRDSFIGEHITTPLASSDSLPSRLELSLPCLTAFNPTLYFLAHLCLMTSDSIPYLHRRLLTSSLDLPMDSRFNAASSPHEFALRHPFFDPLPPRLIIPL